MIAGLYRSRGRTAGCSIITSETQDHLNQEANRDHARATPHIPRPTGRHHTTELFSRLCPTANLAPCSRPTLVAWVGPINNKTVSKSGRAYTFRKSNNSGPNDAAYAQEDVQSCGPAGLGTHAHNIPESVRALCRIVFLTAAKTNRMLEVSVACVRLRWVSVSCHVFHNAYMLHSLGV